jgi:hypothetical protein
VPQAALSLTMRDFPSGVRGRTEEQEEGGNFHPLCFPPRLSQDNDKNKLENLALLMQFQRKIKARSTRVYRIKYSTYVG